MKQIISLDDIRYCMDFLKDKSIGNAIWFDMSGGRTEGFLRLDKGYTADARVYLTVGAVEKGDDHVVQNYLHHAPGMEQMAEWLKDGTHAKEIAESLERLNARVLEGFD